MEFTLEHLDFLLLILVRVTGFLITAPFFSLKNVPVRVKAGFAFLFSLILFQVVPYNHVVYHSTFHYITILVLEALCGIIIGYFANIGYYILALAGHLIDMEIGFSMVNEFDPVSNVQVTLSSNIYSYLIMLMMMITNLHHYVIQAFVDSYTVVPISKVTLSKDLYKLMLQFMIDYFIIGFRIVLPVFAAILMVNVVLAILAKVAPQMNMFVVGMQLKVLVGITVLYFVMRLVPSVADFIFNEMLDMMRNAIYSLAG